MTLSPGTRLGRYELTSPLGAGGMARVYRAVDTQLQREVAIKVITEIGRADLRERFRTEALAIAALNHPNICRIYDAGRHEQTDFIVMEIVDGVTLADRVRRGRLPLGDAITIAREIASALGAAHRAGIVHRDVKPSNIMLSRSGAKLLDFGVARVAPRPALNVEPTVAPSNMTDAGTPVGTWRYMAPEQLRGEPVDSRADVFALGAVIFESVAGRAAFEGATHQELVAAILDGTPPLLRSLVPETPAVLSDIVRVCLEKSPDDRWQAGGDVQRALELVGHGDRDASPRWRHWATVAAAIAAVAMLAFAAGSQRASVDALAAPPVVRVVAPVSEILATTGIAISPDGRTIIYRDTRQLYRYDLGSGTSKAIPGTENGRMPFFSPDGAWLGFTGTNHLMKVPLEGGNPVRIVANRTDAGASWGDDGFIVYNDRYGPGLKRVSADGGDPEVITSMQDDEPDEDHRYPQVLPGGRRVLFSVGTGPDASAKIVAVDLDTKVRKDLIQGSFSFRYVSTGHLAYTSHGVLYAAPFNIDNLELTGAPIKIAEGVEDFEGMPEFDFSRNGTLVYLSGTGLEPQNQLVLVDVNGDETAIGPPGALFSPRFSPDGQRIAVRRQAAKNNVWVYEIGRDTLTQVTFGSYHNPIWTPGGKLTMARGRPGNNAMVIRAADGSGEDEELLPANGDSAGYAARDWTPDGRTLVMQGQTGSTDIVTFDRSAGVKPLIASPREESNPRLSPDGTMLVYAQQENVGGGPTRLMIERFPSRQDRMQVSNDTAMFAVWSRDNRRLYYRRFAAPDSPAGTLWSVDVTPGSPIRISQPQRLFTLTGTTGAFDISPDGEQFVMVKLPNPAARRLQLVINQFAKVK